MSPEGQGRMAAMALDTLHKSCPTTPAALFIAPDIARAIALGYLQLALLPTEAWAQPAEGWPEVEGATIGADWPGVDA